MAEGALELEPGDLVILAADGVETLGEEGIAEVRADRQSEDAGAIAAAILARIEEAPADYQDNATVVVVRPSGSPGGAATAD